MALQLSRRLKAKNESPSSLLCCLMLLMLCLCACVQSLQYTHLHHNIYSAHSWFLASFSRLQLDSYPVIMQHLIHPTFCFFSPSFLFQKTPSPLCTLLCVNNHFPCYTEYTAQCAVRKAVSIPGTIDLFDTAYSH